MSWDSAPIVAKGGAAPAQAKAGWAAAPVAAPSPKGKLKADQGLGFVKGVEKPIDNLAIWLETGAKKLGVPTDAINDALGMPSARDATASHAAAVARAAAQGRRPGLIGETAGSIVGTAPALFEGPLVGGAMQGAALTDNPDDLGGVALDAGKGMALNKIVGAGVDKLSDALAPVIDPAVRKLADAGVRLTPGQIKGGKAMVAEDKAMSRPFVGDRIAADRTAFKDDFNRGAVNRTVFPLGIKLPDDIETGHEAAAWMQEQIGNAYNRVLPKMSLKPDARLATGIQRGWQATAALSDEQRETFKRFLSDKLVFGENGQLSGRGLTIAARDIRDTARKYMQSSTESDRAFGAALDEVSEGLKGALRAQNPQYARELRAADSAYRDSQVVNRASAVADDGVATTAQYKTASRAADRSKGKRSSAAGTAPLQDYVKAGRSVTGKTPDSGTATRLMDGKWIPAARGAVDAGRYEIDKALTQLRLLPRSPQAKKLAGLLAQYKSPMSAIGGPAVGGLLAGLLGND